MVPALEIIINEDQKGFIPNRRIACNIRKIMDVISLCEDPALILQIDFQKAFDRCEHTAVLNSMHFFGFPEIMVKWIEVLYKNFEVKIQNNGNFSGAIKIECSVHQGGAASAAIFICIAELLAISVRSDGNIRGAFINDVMNLLNQYADDTDMCLDGSNGESLRQVFKKLEWFRMQSGCQVNYDKTTIYRTGSLKHSSAKLYTENNLNWEEKCINVLGIEVSNSISDGVVRNFERIINSSKSVLRSWRRRSLSLEGKINIINCLVVSKFVYAMTVLPAIPAKFILEMEQVFEEFIWNGHKPKIPTKMLKAHRKDGGLGLVDLKAKDKSLKVGWIKILAENDDLQKVVDTALKSGLGHTLWRCNFDKKDTNCFEMREDTFWKDVLNAWCEFNFTDRENLDHKIWMNSLIRIADKPFFWKKAAERGLNYVSQLFENGECLPDRTLQENFGLSIMEINSLMTAIPEKIKGYVKGTQLDQKRCEIHSNYVDYILDGKTQQAYRRLCPRICISDRKLDSLSKECGKKISAEELCQKLRNCRRISNIPSVRSFQYRLLTKALVMNTDLYRWGVKSSDMCTFCDGHKETYAHLFFDCEYAKDLWKCAEELMIEDTGQKRLNCESVLLSEVAEKPFHVNNFICTHLKKCIYRNRCIRKILRPEQWRKELLDTRLCEKYIAIKNGKLSIHCKKWGETPKNYVCKESNDYIDEYLNNI